MKEFQWGESQKYKVVHRIVRALREIRDGGGGGGARDAGDEDVVVVVVIRARDAGSEMRFVCGDGARARGFGGDGDASKRGDGLERTAGVETRRRRARVSRRKVHERAHRRESVKSHRRARRAEHTRLLRRFSRFPSRVTPDGC